LRVQGVQGLFLLAVAGTHADAGVSSVVGPPVTGVHGLALVHDVAASMLLKVFLLLSALLLLASMLLSLLMLLLAPMHLLVFLLLLALLFLESLDYKCCSIMSLLLPFSLSHARKVFRTLHVPRRRPFAFPYAGKVFRSPECDLLHSPMPENFVPGVTQRNEPHFSFVFMGQKNLCSDWQDTLKNYDFFIFVQEASTFFQILCYR
jgi:hypothetical protein